MNVEARHIVIEGRVQGVFFRASAEARARELGLAGWVRNRDDGRVEAHAEGPQASLLEFVEWCRQGPPAAQVTRVVAQPARPQGLQSFSIR
ncbi:MAG: acylphosphatase [Nitrospinaceae bacterium]|jgi:acylphosphatase|nr:MAG: acylphosphatase [Nitrospinaceae bacterium]